MLLCLDIVVVIEAVLGEHLFHLLMWTWRDLINHRPGKGNLCLVLQIGEELSGCQSVGNPLLSVCENASLHLVAVV